jgi:UDP-glucose 4-epimerase
VIRDARVLVVGGAGFVGSALVRRLLVQGVARVVVVDNLLSSEADNLPEDARIELRHASITEPAMLAALDDTYDHVFHLATYHGNESSIADPLADHANNLFPTLALFERLTGFRRLQRVIYASTGCALAAKGDGVAEAVLENGPIPLDFDSPYQISKVVGEMYALYYHRQHALPVVRVRFQNVYGPGEVLGAGRWRGTPATIWRNVTPAFIYRALKGHPLPVHGDGSSTRDFIYVDDIVEGLVRAATVDGVVGDVFNLASGAEVTILEWAETINKLTGNHAGIEHIPARAWDRSVHRFGSPAKAKAGLGFVAGTQPDDGLARTVEWTRVNLSRIERCIARHRAHCRVDL